MLVKITAKRQVDYARAGSEVCTLDRKMVSLANARRR